MRVATSFVAHHLHQPELPEFSAPAFTHLAHVSMAPAQKPAFGTQEAANQILRGGYRHYDRDGDGKIELSFTLDEKFSAQQKVSIRQALQMWQDVTTIIFKE